MGWQGRMRRMTRMMLGQPLKDEGFDLGFPRYMYIYTSILLGLLFFCLLVNSCFLIPRPLLHGSGSCCLFTINSQVQRPINNFLSTSYQSQFKFRPYNIIKASSPNPRSDHFSLFFFHLFSFPVCWMVGLQDGLQVIPACLGALALAWDLVNGMIHSLKLMARSI